MAPAPESESSPHNERIKAHLLQAGLFFDRGDLRSAERLYRQAEKSGAPEASNRLGNIFERKNQLKQAERQYRKAAKAGYSAAAVNLGTLLFNLGRIDEAIQFYQQAADEGHEAGLAGLGFIFSRTGRIEEAKQVCERAAARGDVGAARNLGLMFEQEGDLTSAERWYREAARFGNAASMNAIGRILRHKGNFQDAAEWYEQAAQRGYEQAAKSLEEITPWINDARRLESITFETFGWPLAETYMGYRHWKSDSASLTERYLDVRPDLLTTDPAEVHEVVVKSLQDSINPNIEIAEFPQHYHRFLPQSFPDSILLIEDRSFNISSAFCIYILIRTQSADAVVYRATMTLLFAECSWIITLDVHQSHPLKKEGDIAVCNISESADNMLHGHRPDDSHWHSLFPVEDDALTQVRILSQRIIESVSLSEEVTQLRRFESSSQQ